MKINNKYDSVQAIPENIRKACLAASWKSWSRPFVVKADGKFRVVTLNIFERLAAAFLRIFQIDYFKRVLGARVVTVVKVPFPAIQQPPALIPAPANQQPQAQRAPKTVPEDVSEHDIDPIVQPIMTIDGFIKESYKGATAAKYVERLRNLSQYFGKKVLYPTRGDGNCFANATAAGLICLIARDPAKLPNIFKALQDGAKKAQSYVTPDITATAPPYSKGFTKDKDFALVLDAFQNLFQQPQGDIRKLLEKQDFTASFSRVIRYLCLCQQVAQGGLIEVSPRSGEDIDMHAISYANACFGIQAKMAVLEAPVKDVNPDRSDRAYIKGGNQLTFDDAMVDLKKGTPQEKQADFVVIRKAGHYIAMV